MIGGVCVSNPNPSASDRTWRLGRKAKAARARSEQAFTPGATLTNKALLARKAKPPQR
jgi:hypothetical protein